MKFQKWRRSTYGPQSHTAGFTDSLIGSMSELFWLNSTFLRLWENIRDINATG
jgi:hypothetical protein